MCFERNAARIFTLVKQRGRHTDRADVAGADD